jgi:general secretion pathway protein A
MYESFYGFREKPFQLFPNPAYLYKSEKHQNALGWLEYGLTDGISFILLTGEIGSGKTTLVQYIIGQLEDSIEPAVVYNTNVTSEQLLNLILIEFNLRSQSNKADALDDLQRFLNDRHNRGRSCLLIVDEAQNLSLESLEEVRMLSNLQQQGQPLLQIMLVGQPELARKLRKSSLRQLSQRIAARYHLTGLNPQETGEYIAFRLQKAGGSPDLFTPAAVGIIHELAEGIPRAINMICQAALVYGLAEEAPQITQDIVRQIEQDQIGVGLGDDELEEEAGGEGRQIEQPAVAALNNGFQERIENLEGEVRDLRKLLEDQIKKLDRRAETYKNDLSGQLNNLLRMERARNQDLTRKLARMEMLYNSLKRIQKERRRNGNG